MELDDYIDVQEEVPVYTVAGSQQYSHEYSGGKRQKYFNDNVHGRQEVHSHLHCSCPIQISTVSHRWL